MKRSLLAIGKHSVVFLVTLLILWGALVASVCIPNESIRENMTASAEYFLNVGAYPNVVRGEINSAADNFADAVLYNIAWNMQGEDLLEESLYTSYYRDEYGGENSGLYNTIVRGWEPNIDYIRYWHGTAIFVRLFSLFTDVVGVRTIGFTCFIAAMLTALVSLIARKHYDIALILLVSTLAVRAYYIFASIEYQSAFIICFLMITLYLWADRHHKKWLTYLAVISGVLVAFFDFLTNETITLLMPLAVLIAVRAKEGRLDWFSRELPFVIYSGIAWGCAYAFTFMAKWGAVSLVTGENEFSNSLSFAAVRFNGEIVGEEIELKLFTSLGSVINMLFGGEDRYNALNVWLGLGISVAVLLGVFFLLRDKKARNEDVAWLLFTLSAVTIARIMILANHSYQHCFFVYRALITPIFAILTSLWMNVKIPRDGRRKK